MDYNPVLGFASSPVYNILETASGLPFINQTQFGNWLSDTQLFRDARNFQADRPGWEGEYWADLAGALVPFAGWGMATAKAGTVGTGLLQATNRATIGAASFFPKSPILAGAVGEAVRFAPLSAGIEAFNLAGGRYDSPTEALVNFGLGTLGGAAFQGVGHALSPTVARLFPPSAEALSQGFTESAVTTGWRALFEPGPELEKLYGYSNNVRRAATQASQLPRVAEAMGPGLEPQTQAVALWDVLEDMRFARERQANGAPIEDPRLLDPEIETLLRGQHDTTVRQIIQQELDPVESAFPPMEGFDLHKRAANALDMINRPGVHRGRTVVTQKIDGTPGSLNSPDRIAREFEFPQEWLQYTRMPRVVRSTAVSGTWLRRELGIEPTAFSAGFHNLLRARSDGTFTSWGAVRDRDGWWQLTTQIPGEFPLPRELGRDFNEQGRAFFNFKTKEPWRFLPELRRDLDSPEMNTETVGFYDRIPRGKSEFLDRLMDMRQVFMNPDTIKAMHQAKGGAKGAKERMVREALQGPTAGRAVADAIETFAAPRIQQLKNAPDAQSILMLYESVFDAAEGRARALLHGTASIQAGKSPLGSLFTPPNINDDTAVVAQLRKLYVADPDSLDVIRQFMNEEIPLESLDGTPVGDWLKMAMEVGDGEIDSFNGMIESLRKVGATDAKTIPKRSGHVGVSRRWEGTNIVPIYLEGSASPDTLIAGNSLQQAQVKAKRWLDNRAQALARVRKKPEVRRMGQPFRVGEDSTISKEMQIRVMTPGFIEPRRGIMGWENQYEKFNHVDELIAQLEEGYVQRARYAASVGAKALTGGRMNYLRNLDLNAFKIVETRVNQMHGEQGPLDRRMNEVVDKVAGPILGTNSLTKTVDAVNGMVFHLLHGVMYPGTAALNLTSVVQTQLPAGIEFLTMNPKALAGVGYQVPRFAADGTPRPGFNFITDPIGLMRGGLKKATDPNDVDREVFNVLFNRRIMGTGLANEYTGADRSIVARASEGIRSADDVPFWASRISSILMSKSEQISRTMAAGIAMKAMDMYELAHGVKFTIQQRIDNAANMVARSNYAYFPQDRPMMYTTPLGALFGNQKTWMTNYLFMMAHYFGLATKGNVAPLLFSAGTTALLGGVLAVPLIGAGMDAFTETFADQDVTEFMFDRFGEAGNGISFGLPAMFGMSLHGNVAAPGSNLAHDSEFFFTIVALERAKLMGRAIGTAMDDQLVLGMNPLENRVFQQQAMQAFAPRAVYRSWEALTSDQLRSAATGYPMVEGLGWGQRVMHGLGFRNDEIALQYELYDRLTKDRNSMRNRIAVYGEAYAIASIDGDVERMNQVIQRATVEGMDMSAIMRSAQTRMRNAGKDMFGRNFTGAQLERYQESLGQAGYEVQ